MREELGRTEFVNLVAHELKNPLTTISGASQLLQMDLDQLPERSRKAVELLVRQTERAQTLIRDLLDLSRVRSARFSIEMKKQCLRHVVDETLAVLVRPEGKTVEVSVDEAVEVMADAIRLQQVLTNLISNAYKYGGANIKIDAEEEGSTVAICVEDDGPGLPEDYLQHLFEPFQRASTAIGHGGSGLGLAITKGLVEAHNGTIRYEHADPIGARFLFVLEGCD
jgi:signal transduction histidine kinase